MEKGEKRMEFSEQDILSHIQYIPGGIFVYQADRDGAQKFAYVSESMAKLLGYASVDAFREKFGDSFRDMVYEEDRERVQEQIYRHVAHSNDDYCDYRIERADGSLMWVYDRGHLEMDAQGNQWFYVVVVDADEIKKKSIQLQMQTEKLNILMRMQGAITFDYDPAGDVLSVDISDSRGSLTSKTEHGLLRNMDLPSWLHPTYAESILLAFRKALAQAGTGNFDIFARLLQDSYEWYRVTYTSIADVNGIVFRVVGRADNVNAYIERANEWAVRASRDTLTGLLNHESLINGVQTGISLYRSGILFMVDVDQFKQINDTYGHLYGDQILIRVADAVRYTFRSSDVVGRYGGDEFVAFIPGTSNEQLAASKASLLEKKIEDIELKSGRRLSCSVGVAYCSAGILTARDLIWHADKALYDVKKSSGKYFLIETAGNGKAD